MNVDLLLRELFETRSYDRKVEWRDRPDLDDDDERILDLSEDFRAGGGPGSGNFGHVGRPGAVGGSAAGGGESLGYTGPHIVFHGTQSQAIASIKKHGLSPFTGVGTGADEYARQQGADMGGRPASVYFTESLTSALRYAKYAAEINDEAEPLILRVEIPREWWTNNVRVEDQGDALAVKTTIPPEWITEVGSLSSEYYGRIDWRSLSESHVVVYSVILVQKDLRTAGGPGSGNFGHAGRPGEIGGSSSGGGSSLGSYAEAVVSASPSCWDCADLETWTRGLDPAVAEKFVQTARYLHELSFREGESDRETLTFLNKDTGDSEVEILYGDLRGVDVPGAVRQHLDSRLDEVDLVSMHTHPSSSAFSPQDLGMTLKKGVDGVVIGKNGTIYEVSLRKPVDEYRQLRMREDLQEAMYAAAERTAEATDTFVNERYPNIPVGRRLNRAAISRAFPEVEQYHQQRWIQEAQKTWKTFAKDHEDVIRFRIVPPKVVGSVKRAATAFEWRAAESASTSDFSIDDRLTISIYAYDGGFAPPVKRALGGPGSGNYGHAGRPGQIGGSAPGTVHGSTDLVNDGAVLDALMQKESYTTNRVENLAVRINNTIGLDDDPTSGSHARTRDGVRHRIKLWTETSGDSNPEAVRIQHAVIDEFNLEGAITNHLSESPEPNVFDNHYLRAEYENTQQWFKDRNISHVTVYRGQFSGLPEEGSGEIIVQTQPATSWSLSINEARQFTATYLNKDSGIIGMRVPVSRVLSTGVTGRGSISESELILLGGKYRVKLRP